MGDEPLVLDARAPLLPDGVVRLSVSCAGGGMTWAKFDDGCPDHPKIARLSDAAHRLWFNAVCYGTRMLTDGFVPDGMIGRLTPRRTKALVEELVKAGLWHLADGGYDIHDFLTYQPSREDVLRRRAADSARKPRQNPNGIAPESKRPVPDPSRTRRSRPDQTPPVVPPGGGDERAQRALRGSKRKRDQEALDDLGAEAYLSGKYGSKVKERMGG